MKVSTNINPYAIEIDFKTELMSKCDIVLKEYVKEKLKSLKSKQRTENSKMLIQFYERFIVKYALDVEYSIIASLIFCNEFTIIREQVEMGLIDFNHFRDPEFWDKSPSVKTTHNNSKFSTAITTRDAIFFVYTTMDNFYPQSREVVANMLDYSEKNEKFNYYNFFKDITYI